jgi:hypothetical protein
MTNYMILFNYYGELNQLGFLLPDVIDNFPQLKATKRTGII